MDQYDKAKRIARLVNGYRLDYLSDEERDELERWRQESDANEELFNQMLAEQDTKETQRWLEDL